MSKLQIIMIIASFIFLLAILFSLRKNSMSIKNSIAWLLLPIVLLLIAIFPTPIETLSHFLGFEVLSNFIFLIIIGLLVIICFYLTVTISQLQTKITKLIQEIAILKKNDHDKKSK
ncbi:DUF2304 domain-containing protein [Candidatus Saccharibacteria bacterium]|nr:DUF2304 domain-containing protein [Candidatus Saccharibacteria bacterium]MBR3138927.1 DUF2304 domain-containing protein [Candidatus Saccharibacteria bacterium]